MLVIGARQEAALDAAMGDCFLAELQDYLAGRDPGLLPVLDPSARPVVVAAMVGRARRCGVKWRSSTALFCDLMQLVAPDFYRHPAVRGLYVRDGADPDALTQQLADLVPAATWEEIAGQRSDLPLYTPPEADDLPLVERIAAALPIILWGRVKPGAGANLAGAGLAEAARLGLSDADDAGLVLAAIMHLYPSTRALPDWAEAAAAKPGSTQAKLELMRLRAALDHGRRI